MGHFLAVHHYVHLRYPLRWMRIDASPLYRFSLPSAFLHQVLGACALKGLPGRQPTLWAIFWHTHDSSLLHSSSRPPHCTSPSSGSLSLITCRHMILSTSTCFCKFINQSKLRLATAKTKKFYVSIVAYSTPCTISLTRHGIPYSA